MQASGAHHPYSPDFLFHSQHQERFDMFKTYDHWKTTEPDPCDEPQERMRHQRKIITHHVYPPIPSRQFDWIAHYDGDDELGEYGHGPTEQAAIADLAMTYPQED
jgi:hypothetical protein